MNEQTTCPACGEELEFYDSGKVKVYNRWVNWERWKCINPNCNYEWTNEPDYD